MDAGRHPLIEIITNAEVTGCKGRPGDFTVRVRKNPRFVDEDLCVACGLCVDVCPQVGGNEFDVGLKARKAIYRPFPQSVPAAYVIDLDACLNDTILFCDHCSRVCEPDAIDFDQQPEDIEIAVGSILVAVGFQEFDARTFGAYGYGRFPNVVTSLELERMLNASGVTGGHVVRPSDLKTPRRIVFIQCVGARGEGGRQYCSRFCCMNAVKGSMLMRQHDPEIEDITILYTDLRAFGKGFDDFVQRSLDEESATYIRGRPAKVTHVEADDTLEVFVEDTLGHRQQRIPADLVVLSVAAAPNEGAMKLAKRLRIKTDDHGFIARKNAAVSAVETSRDGIFACGSSVGPQVIPDCVAQASAAASRAEFFLTGHRREEEAVEIEPMDLSGPPRVGVMVCHCGVNVAGVLDVDGLAEHAASLPDVVAAQTDLFACSSTGQDAMVEFIRDNNLNRIVIAACTPRTHEPVFRAACAQIGFNPFLLEMVNIRDQCSWVHGGKASDAQEKARTLIRMGVARARHLQPLYEGRAPMTQAALVIGGGIAGIRAATDLAIQGFQVTLVEKEDQIGGRLAAPNLKYLYPNMAPAAEVLKDNLRRLKKSRARVLTGTEVESISGFVGNFEAKLKGGSDKVLRVGTIILAIGADLYDPRGEYRYGEVPNVVTSVELERIFCQQDGALKVGRRKVGSAAFILCVGSREPDGFTGCSRYCCPTAIKQAIQLQRRGIDTTIFYRDIRTVSTGAEEMYREARGLGVLFVRIPPKVKPEVGGEKRAEVVRCYDELLDRPVEVPVDLVVLSVGLKPKMPDTAELQDMLKVSRGSDGFFMERHPELAPVETAVEGVFLAGTAHGPKDIVDSVAQASAAAAKASVLLASDHVKLQPTIGEIEQAECSECGLCARVCPFQAIQWQKGAPAELVKALCAGCGTCGAACPTGAITMLHFTDEQLLAQVRAMLEEEPQNKVVVFACNWCSYAGADMAGISRLQYPPTGHLIRTMCSGRVSEEMVLEAFRHGAPVVLVSGCHYADCHYIDANRQTVKRVQKLWRKLESAGVRPERLQLEWISAAEGQKFAAVMAQMEDLRATVTADEIAHARTVLKPKPKKAKGEDRANGEPPPDA
jgi:heterodisulfide reductase subunit A